MKLITALCLLCLVIKPIGAVLDGLPDRLLARVEEAVGEDTAAREGYEAILEGTVMETVREQLRDAVTRQLSERFSVSHCEVGVSLTRTDGVLVATRVVITLMGRDIFKDPYAIEAYFGDLLDCECVVVVG